MSSKKLSRGKRARIERARRNKRKAEAPHFVASDAARILAWHHEYRRMMNDLVHRNPGLADDDVRVVVFDSGVVIRKEGATDSDVSSAINATRWVKPAWAIPDENPKPLIVKPPGELLLRAIQWLPMKEVREEVIQCIADMRDEHFQALQNGDPEQARKIAIRGRVAAFLMILPLLFQWAWGLVALLRRWFAAGQ